MPPKSVSKFIFPLVLSVTIFLLGESVLWAQGKVTIRKELPVGKYMMEQDILISQSVALGQQNSVGRQKAQIFWNLEIAGPATRRTATLRLKSIAFNMRTNAGEESSFGYNPSQLSTASSELKEIYRKLLDLTAKVEFDATLNPIRITEMEDWTAFLSQETARTDEGAVLLMNVLRNLLTPEMIKGYFNQLYYLLPATPVAVGDSWTGETNLALPKTKDINVRWQSRLDRLQGNASERIAEVSGTGTIRANEETEIKCDVETKFSVKTGLPFSVAFRSTISRTDKIKIGEKEEAVKTTHLFRSSQMITPL